MMTVIIKRKIQQQGFTLIELMIALLIGLFLMCGVISVFAVNQKTVNAKLALDNTEEALRFSTYTVNRMIRQADVVSNTSTGSSMAVSFTGTGGSDIKNCLGQSIAGVQTDTFTYSSSQLLCNNTPLVSDVTAVSFLYGVDANNDGWVSNSEYTTAPSDFTKVNSIRMSISLTNGKTHSVTSTIRNKVINKYAG